MLHPFGNHVAYELHQNQASVQHRALLHDVMPKCCICLAVIHILVFSDAWICLAVIRILVFSDAWICLAVIRILVFSDAWMLLVLQNLEFGGESNGPVINGFSDEVRNQMIAGDKECFTIQGFIDK